MQKCAALSDDRSPLAANAFQHADPGIYWRGAKCSHKYSVSFPKCNAQREVGINVDRSNMGHPPLL